jgi:hypothetical protein
MIPMERALLALSRGDAASMGRNLVVAFSAVTASPPIPAGRHDDE